ncbi:MAG: sterol desaturase family protein [Acidocella sp.]|nr:sterol desaturase family protein [Acidocella sp.]
MLLEFCKHGSNLVLGLVVVLVTGMVMSGLWMVHPWLFLLGAVLFFTSEYTFHRYAFHARPMTKVAFILKLQHRLHYDHHSEPNRLDLLFLPLWFVLPNLAMTGGLAWLIWPSVESVGTLLAGTSAAILYYEWVHFVAHIPYKPRTAWGRWIKKYHLWHHFKNERLWFGVTNPSFDFIMRSYEKVADAAASATTRNLHP